MATEKFFVFNEAGVLKRLKGRIVRFLDNEDPDNDDKVAIRSSLSVPASAEGLTPANNLSDVSSVSASRANLSVNSKDEDAQANALKTTAPALYFNGTSSLVTVAHDAKQHFNNGTDDLPFAISFWVNTDFAVAGGLVAKYQAGAKEFVAWVTGNGLRFNLSDGTDEPYIQTASLTAYSNKWTHVAITSEGAGPNFSNDFPAAVDALKVYVNAVDITSGAATQNEAAYGGLNNSSAAITLMSFSAGNFKKGSIRDVKIFNRELTATELAELARGNDLGFADEWGGAFGGVGTIDETVGLSSWSGAGSATPTNLTETANTTVGGRPNVLQQQATATVGTATKIAITNVASVGKRVRIEFDYYINSGNVTLDTILVASPTATIATLNTAGAWTRASIETVLTSTTVELQITDGASYNATALDFVGFDNFTITEIGTLADFRAEDYNESASKLLDRSSNNFVGVGTSVTLTGNQRHISADTIDLKNLPTSSAGLSAGEVWSNSGVLTVV